MPRKLAVGNWKMHTTRDEAVALAQAVAAGVAELDGWDPAALGVGLAPPFPFLEAVGAAIAGSRVELVAQDAHPQPKGAFTSAVSVPMLASVGVQQVIIGHSERRAHFGDDDAAVRAKVEAVLAGGLQVIVCVGERLEEREAGREQDVVGGQVRAALQGLESLAAVSVAYEPVWAIGTGKTATPEQAGAMHEFIRGVVAEFAPAGESPTILYGGSVKPGNAEALAQTPHVGGVLVGGASLKAETFIPIVRACAAAS